MKLFVFVLFFLTFFSNFLLKCDTYILGKILDFNRNPIVYSDISILKLDEDSVVEHYNLKNGFADSKVNIVGIYRIRFTGISHKAFEIPFVFRDSDDTLNFEAQLEPFYFKFPPEKISIMGNFNDFNWDSPVYLNKGPNNIYSGVIKKKDIGNDTIIYQVIIDDTVNGNPVSRSINGTQGDFFKLDKGFSDYYSYIIEKGEKVQIQFDLGKFPNKKITPSFKVLNKNSRSYEFIDGYFSIVGRRQKFDEKVKETGSRKNKGITGFLGNPGDKLTVKGLKNLIYTELDVNYRAFKDAKYLETKEMYALEYIKYIGGLLALKYSPLLNAFARIDIQKDKVKEVLSAIKPNSILLSYQDFYPDISKLLAVVICHLNQPKYFKFLDSLLDVHSSDHVKIGVLDACIEFFQMLKRDKERMNYYYQKLLADFPNSSTTSYYRGKIERKVKIGSACPNFVTSSLWDTTKKVSLSDYKGKYLLIDFWSTTCGPCIAEFPFLLEAYNKYKGKNFEILSISLDNDYKKALNYVEKNKHKLPWAHAIETKSFRSRIAKDFDVLAIPLPILIDPNGKVIATDVEIRGKYLLNKLKAIFK